MKNTTESKLSEQSYADWLRLTEPTDKKREVAFMYNEYAWRFGIPMKLEINSPVKYAKICAGAVLTYSRWMAAQVREAWGV